MKNNFTILILISTPLMAISTNSWILLWITLELSTMSFIMIMIMSKINFSKETSMKYFLIQSSASCFMLMGFLFKENNITQMKMTIMIPSYIIIMALLTKMAAAPFHLWLSPLTIKMSWNTLAILLTWMKLAPLMMLLKISSTKVILLTSMMSMLMGTISQFNITSSKLIMTFSSINHMGWMLMSLISNLTLPIIYLCIYSSISVSLMMSFKKISMKSLSHQTNKSTKIPLTILILSLAGIPPLMGFIPKWMVLSNSYHKIKSTMILTSMVVLASISFFIYIRLIMSPLLNQSPNFAPKSEKKIKPNFTIMVNILTPIFITYIPK